MIFRLEMQNSRYDMYFSDQVGAYKNSAFLTDTNHQVGDTETNSIGQTPIDPPFSSCHLLLDTRLSSFLL